MVELGAAKTAVAENDVKISFGHNQEQWISLMKLINDRKTLLKN